MIDDLAATPAQVAKALQISESTVYRWLARGAAPRAAELALYWITRWGRAELDASLEYQARNALGLARCLQENVTQLEYRLARVAAIGDFGAANDPAPGAPTRPQIGPPSDFSGVAKAGAAGTPALARQRPSVLMARGAGFVSRDARAREASSPRGERPQVPAPCGQLSQG